jgi:3-(3-hydroxy-phenyl)propionate hydroxylase
MGQPTYSETASTNNHEFSAVGQLVLVFGIQSAATLQRLRRLCLDAPVRCVQVLGAKGAAQALEHVRDSKGHVQGACQASANGWALVRPDGYLAATGETINIQLVQAIERSLGLRAEPA